MYCKHCGKRFNPNRCIGWSQTFCQPLCESKQATKEADAFKAWWERPRD